MFTAEGPTVRELAVQALSSTERGYDLLAPTFDHTPFRTPDRMLDAVEEALAQTLDGPVRAGLDLCCGTGAAIPLLRRLCRERVTGVDFSAGMLARAERTYGTRAYGAQAYGAQGEAGPGGAPGTGSGSGGGPYRDEPDVDFVRADARALPRRLAGSYDLAVSFGAFGHFLPAERPALFAGVHAALRPGGIFAFPVGAPLRPSSPAWWATVGFDAVMRVRNALWRPPFVMYYRTFPLGGVRADLEAAGFAVETQPLEPFGRRPDGAPHWRLLLARRAPCTA
ncbi:class I SAM-dependent methyltransferase [Streptomyces bambusae]|uniref:Methyltransferase domain-containing protein n=1 Tax=Streptomyces bambusae TaxID=1550616 RepID=A0ABS6Z816_9ACTN|nr:class I SAM-dependent methyltransferase [Streptomyces bambusae]MBW5483910.1 methyltransferase domain-containing protein [Streptomyces bambusae]